MGAKRPALRVIGGTLKGRRLRVPAGFEIRPTGDRVREALFDILGRDVDGAAFLDAYAGTGAVGVEALSRGARLVAFVEKSPETVALLRQNLETAGELGARTRVLGCDLAFALRQLASDGASFDIVYLDPPYEGGELDRALRLVGQSSLLTARGVVVAEHDVHSLLKGGGRLHAVRTVTYGNTALTFHHAAPGESPSMDTR
ncbi:MAG: 16S rRNA (guanine(966)-N(2))-methyltransferase RsmD [Candidatus Polarisedimenticolia bacterium]